jgi:peroxiredoxin
MRIQTGPLVAACLTLASFASVAAVPHSPQGVTPVAVGSAAPAFTAREVDGRVFRFQPQSLKRPTLIILYRGGWCPFCNAHLKDLRSVEPKIVALGYDVLFLSSDRPEILYSSLKEKVDYHILSDATMAGARALGVAYRLDDETYQKYKSFGVDLEETQGEKHHELPVPALFIVDRSGIVRFRYFNADYRVRLPADKVLAAAQDAMG